MTLMVIVKYGENFKQNINLSIGLFGHTQYQKIGVIELRETYNNKINLLKK
jgi:hypothetical protein